MKKIKIVLIILIVCLQTSCEDYPRDTHGALNKVIERGDLRVGLIEHPPWVYDTHSEPQGSEVELVEDFAKGLGVNVKWFNTGEHLLIAQLQKGELDIVIGGLLDNTVWNKTVALTRPYRQGSSNNHTMAIRLGENAFLIKLEKFLREKLYA